MLWWLGRLLVLAALLTAAAAAAALDTEEIQKEDEHLVFVAAGEGEGPPENVTVTPVGSTALNVSWDPPEEPPLYYIVRIDSESIENDTSNTYFLVEGLEPCQYYYIRVLSRYNDRQYAATVSGTTNTPVPPSPQSCWFSDVHTSTLDVNWNDTQFKCGIVGHRISWWLDVLWSDEESTNQTTTTDHQIHLTNLRPYTNVTASVEAESDTGYGQPTTCWNVTDQDTPGAPVITSITSYELSLYVAWSPPEEVNGDLGDYEINIVSEQDGREFTVYTSDTETVISNLSQCEPYLIKLRVQTDAGWGPYSDTWNITHNVTVAPNFVECREEESFIMACWAPCSPACLNSSDTQDLYTVTWHGDVLWSSDADSSGSGPLSWEEVPELCYQLPDPSVPYTNYSLCVGVYGHVTATGCCSALTPQAVPGPPVITSLTSS